jgi:putative SOS response-associated peptidase YedK
MCYNIAFLTKRLEKYAERYKDTLPPRFSLSQASDSRLPEYHFVSGFEYPRLPVVTGTELLFCQWGLIPSWIKDAAAAEGIRSRTLNAACETVFEKPSFRKGIASQRCLLGIDGFYEWRLFNKNKYPYFITANDDSLLSLGCIFDSWTHTETGEIFHTFSVITTPANPLLETIHNTKKRMPLIIGREDEPHWVDLSLPASEVMKMIRPYDENLLEAYTVPLSVNNVRNNRNQAQSMHRAVYPELTLFG